ncbi:MAG: glycosyltransferase family 39 protein [Planctomycetes bacterium]|nr:glycosyltransferase family 39 protein [Planctomycetota bacterium]
MSAAPPPDLAPGATCRGPRIVLALALCVGLLRFWRLGTWSYWIDEAYTVADWSAAVARGGVWNPLGYRALRAATALLGGELSEWKLRALPALAGWLAVPLAYWALRPAFGRPRAAWSALLLALSSWLVFWSQTGRFYTLALLLSLAGAGLVLRAVRSGRAARGIGGFLVAAAAAAFHPTAALLLPGLVAAPFVVAGRGGHGAGDARRVGRALLVAVLVCGVLALPWTWSTLVQHATQKHTADLLSGPLHLALTVGYFVTPAVGAAALLGALRAWRTREAAGLFAATLVATTLLAALALSGVALMTAQYVLAALPWVLALALQPLAEGGRGARTLALVLALALAADLGLYFTSRGGERPRWREAYAYVDARREPGDLVLGMAAPIGELYLGAAGADPRVPLEVAPLGDWFPDGPRRWSRQPRRTWVVLRPQWLASLAPRDRADLEAWLAADARLARRFPVEMEGRDLDLEVWLREP